MSLVLGIQRQNGLQWQTVPLISPKICSAIQTMNDCVNKAVVEGGGRAGVSSETAERIKALELENRELRQANEILPKASAILAMAELDSWQKT